LTRPGLCPGGGIGLDPAGGGSGILLTIVKTPFSVIDPVVLVQKIPGE